MGRLAPGPIRRSCPRRSWQTPLLLFIATIASTFWIHYPYPFINPEASDAARVAGIRDALLYCGGIMFILTAHELGHFVQALRYRVPTSYPYFIPMPISLIGTMGAVIALRGHMGNRKTLFDIGISGPLAGLVPAIVLSVIGIQWSQVLPTQEGGYQSFGEPLLFTWLIHWLKGPLPQGTDVMLHPLAFAGWVGFLITSINLFPVGQLDGGHILYAILRRKSYPVALLVLVGAGLGMVLLNSYQLLPMLLLLIWMRPFHPPTANDAEPLGLGRTILGIATLMFLVVGFTPTPFQFNGTN